MAKWILDDPVHPRRAVFLRTQAPFIMVVLILVALGYVLGLNNRRDEYTLAGGVFIVVATVVSLVVPWERLPRSSSMLFPVLDLCGVAALAIALHGSVNTVPVLTIFPAIWLAMDHDAFGTVVAVIGAFTASIAPILLYPLTPTAEDWLEALVVPTLISVAAIASAVMAKRTETAREEFRLLAAERDTVAAENARLGGAVQSFARQVDIGIVFFDEDGGIVVANDAARRYGELADVGGGSARYAFADDQVTPLRPEDQPLNRVQAGNVVDDLLLWVGPPGDQKALLANGAPVISSAGAQAGSFLVLQDLTAVIRASRDRESALATLTHELRTPLTAIIGFLDLTDLDDQPAEAEKVAIATRNAEHMLALTAAFLDDLRAPAEPDRHRISLSALVAQALVDAASLPGHADRIVDVDIRDDADVLVDPEAIRRMLNNLLSNAVKFSEPQGTIRVTTRREVDTIAVRVGNTGTPLGIDELERVFDRFHRGANAQSQATPGTGLGLTISREIAQRHGGTLTAAREENHTVFTVRLPLGS